VRRPALLAALIAKATLLFAVTAAAHDFPTSHIDLTLSPDHCVLRATVHAIDLAHDLGPSAPEDSLLDRDFLARSAGAVFPLLSKRITLLADGAALPASFEVLAPDPSNQTVLAVMRYPLASKPKSLEARGLLFPHDPLHITLFDVRQDGKIVHEDFFNQDRTSIPVPLTGKSRTLAVVRRFTEAGIHHIFIGPDHILFIVGLLLLGGGIGRLLKIVTAFTLAHSITLTLATLGILEPPGELVEPLIALSIVYVGLDNLRAKEGRRDPRALLAFAFGFVHGFGFASVLRDFGIPAAHVGWALFSFNLGVEIGQACIVGIAAPILGLIRARLPRLGSRIVQVGSLGIAAAGAWWFVERTFLSM
jgi:hypothetical protein